MVQLLPDVHDTCCPCLSRSLRSQAQQSYMLRDAPFCRFVKAKCARVLGLRLARQCCFERQPHPRSRHCSKVRCRQAGCSRSNDNDICIRRLLRQRTTGRMTCRATLTLGRWPHCPKGRARGSGHTGREKMWTQVPNWCRRRACMLPQTSPPVARVAAVDMPVF